MFNDDGIPLNLNIVFILLMMPNFIFLILTIFSVYLIRISKNHPELQHLLGKLANFFSKNALDNIITNVLKHFEKQIPIVQQDSFNIRKSSHISKNLFISSSFKFNSKKKYDIYYLLLVPFQIDLLLTVFVYKILTRDVYPETCQSYLTTYHNRPTQVVCWLKNMNRNVSNLSANLTLYQYCKNQTITYINYEHNDVICAQYAFKLINIIDTITNIFAWHQAIVFVVTRSIVLSYSFQHKLQKTFCWFKLADYQRHMLVFTLIYLVLLIYILLFIIILPIRFILIEERRIDLTQHLLYACSKFIVAIIVHVNLYTLYHCHLFISQKKQLLTLDEEQKVDYDGSVEPNISVTDSIYATPSDTYMIASEKCETQFYP